MTEFYIYELTNTYDDLKYIGSTVDTKQRWSLHLSFLNSKLPYSDYGLYIHWREIQKLGHTFTMKILKKAISQTKDEQFREEQLEIDKHPKELLLNIIRSQRNTDVLRQQQHQYCAKYYENNKDILLAKRKLKRQEPEYKLKLNLKRQQQYREHIKDPEWVLKENRRKLESYHKNKNNGCSKSKL